MGLQLYLKSNPDYYPVKTFQRQNATYILRVGNPEVVQ